MRDLSDVLMTNPILMYRHWKRDSNRDERIRRVFVCFFNDIDSDRNVFRKLNEEIFTILDQTKGLFTRLVETFSIFNDTYLK